MALFIYLCVCMDRLECCGVAQVSLPEADLPYDPDLFRN